MRDLRVYAQANDDEVFYCQDKSGLEADAVVHLKDGRWGAVEAKLGAGEIDIAAVNLLKLQAKINTDKTLEPSFLMVLTGAGMRQVLSKKTTRQQSWQVVFCIICMKLKGQNIVASSKSCSSSSESIA